MARFMQTLEDKIFEKVEKEAKDKGLKPQDVVRLAVAEYFDKK